MRHEILVLASVEGILLNSDYALYSSVLAYGGFLLLPLLGTILRSRGVEFRVVFEACGLLFVNQIILLPFPVGMLESAFILPIAYTILMIGAIMYLWLRKVPFDKVGLWKGTVRLHLQIFTGTIVGLTIGFIQRMIIRPEPTNLGPNLLQDIFYVIIVMFIFVSLTEELLFRGIVQTHMTGFLSQGQSIYLTSMIFSVFHIRWSNPFEILSASITSFVFGYMMIKTNSLLSPVLAHGLSNVTLYLLTL